MSFIGNAPAAIPTSFQAVQADSFNGNGSTTNFTLSRQITNLYDIEVLVDNVQQSPYDGSYSVNGTTITFSSAPGSGTNNIYIIYRDHPITSIAPKGQEIELFSSGGGTFTVTPASSATDRTFTLPDETGTIVTTGSSNVVTSDMQTGDAIPLGVDQTWQDVTSSRANNTTYTNTTGRPIQVMVVAYYGADSNLRNYSITINGTQHASYQMRSNITGNFGIPSSFIVPVNGTYSVSFYAGFTSWSELR